MEQKALAILTKYFIKNKKIIDLDVNAQKILKINQNVGIYYEYDIEELKALFKKENIDFQKLSKEINDIFFENQSAFFAPWDWQEGSYIIGIRKNVPSKYVICEFIHEFCHYQYNLGAWKSRKTDNTLEEVRCRGASNFYAILSGFYNEYLKTMKNLFYK